MFTVSSNGKPNRICKAYWCDGLIQTNGRRTINKKKTEQNNNSEQQNSKLVLIKLDTTHLFFSYYVQIKRK